MGNGLTGTRQNNIINNFVKTDDILKDMCGIIESSQKAAYQAVNTTLVQRNWLIGYRIASEEMKESGRAKYGTEIIKKLSKELTRDYGKGLTTVRFISTFDFIKHFPKFWTR